MPAPQTLAFLPNFLIRFIPSPPLLFLYKRFLSWNSLKIINNRNGIGLGGIIIPEKICSICHNKFHLHEHQSGLVFDDKIFICGDCQSNTPEDDIIEWSQSVMQKPGSGMPIGIWLVHEQNKNKPLFSQKK